MIENLTRAALALVGALAPALPFAILVFAGLTAMRLYRQFKKNERP